MDFMEFNVSNMTNFPQQSYNFMNNIGTNPIVIIVLVVIIGLYYLIFALLGNRGGDTGSSSENGSTVFIEALLWGVFIVLILF
jgi:heme/copper-type cytochrome/quinol oxidase subunit 2